MTSISSELKIPVAGDATDNARQRRSQKTLRRKRSLRSMIKRHLHKILRSRHFFRVCMWLLLLTAFIYVSLKNNVLAPRNDVAYLVKNVPGTVDNSTLTVSDVGTLKPDRMDSSPSVDNQEVLPLPTGSGQTESETQLTNAWSTVDLRSLNALPIVGDEGKVAMADGANDDFANDDLLVEDSADTRSNVDGGASTYVVNEGGSLWRTGRRFVDNEVLLDRLIDNLEQNGMNVRNISAGVAFTVNDLGSKGKLVVIEDDSNRYESIIVDGRVTTSVFGGDGVRRADAGT